MTKDIVQRLRDAEPCIEDICKMRDARSGCCCASAADEIERLRAALKAVMDHGDANGMQDWRCMKIARKALNHEQSKEG